MILASFSLWLAKEFIAGVSFYGSSETFLFCGLSLGLINFFIKPILEKIAFPLKFLTLGFFTLVINMAILWFLRFLFPEIEIIGVLPLFWTAITLWLLNFLSKLK